jgi:hypothetical protein
MIPAIVALRFHTRLYLKLEVVITALVYSNWPGTNKTHYLIHVDSFGARRSMLEKYIETLQSTPHKI